MAELWSLLHFIMPTLFDNHAQFSEWFSKGVEGASQGKEDTLSDYQLKRLHAILKPFMLRRVKSEVAVEMVEKHEVNVLCDLSRRQRMMYDALRRKVPIADLMKSGGVLSDRRVMSLMNLVMQLRKVCNHPELFDPAYGRSSLYCALPPPPVPPVPHTSTGVIEYLSLTHVAHGFVRFALPKLLWRDGCPLLPYPAGGAATTWGKGSAWLPQQHSVFHPAWVHEGGMRGIHHDAGLAAAAREAVSVLGRDGRDSGWGFLRLAGFSAGSYPPMDGI
jgi:DNA helicase INO80